MTAWSIKSGSVASGEPVLLDSVILIDHFNGIEVATQYLRGVSDRASISVITRTEVLTGFAGDDLAFARALLDRFPLLTIDRAVADFAAELRRSHGWRLPDAFQVAVARQHGLFLATRDIDHFPPGRFDFVRIPYSL